MRWQYQYIRRSREAGGMAYECRVCGHKEYADKTNAAWYRIQAHVTQQHPEQRLINKGRTA